MNALVVYESMFGNTQKVAQAIGEGLSTEMDVDVQEVGVAPDKIGDQVTLLVVGAPTHAFSLSRETPGAKPANRLPEAWCPRAGESASGSGDSKSPTRSWR
jgi:hypothetical protein